MLQIAEQAEKDIKPLKEAPVSKTSSMRAPTTA